jgi:hypothetical protein
LAIRSSFIPPANGSTLPSALAAWYREYICLWFPTPKHKTWKERRHLNVRMLAAKQRHDITMQ